MLKLASDIAPGAITVDSFWWALRRGVRRGGRLGRARPALPDERRRELHASRDAANRAPHRRPDPDRRAGDHLPRDRRARTAGAADARCATATRPRWRAGSREDGYVLTEWETDLSSQTGASQAGILLGSNEDIPAFRWVEKESGRAMTCSKPDDCAEIEGRHSSGVGLLRDGGASRGNLLSGEADHLILTVSRINEEKRSNPGYRAFFANGFNVTRLLVLFFLEVLLELSAAARSARRDVRPRGHRGGTYAFMRAAMCVFVRDLIVFGVISDMMKGRPAVYATFSSYDEVAHHSGLERADTLEALRKLDQQFGRIERARRYTPRPYEIVVLSDHGQTQGATFKQRNGYTLADLVDRSLSSGKATRARLRRREQLDGRPRACRRRRAAERARTGGEEATRGPRGGGPRLGQPRARLPDGGAAPADARGDRGAPPEADPGAPRASARRRRARRARRSTGPSRSGRAGAHYLADGRGRGRGPARALLAERAEAPAPHGRLPARRRHDGQQLLRPAARRGLRVRGADLVPRRARRPADAARSSSIPAALPVPPSRSSGRRPCTTLLTGWRRGLQGGELQDGPIWPGDPSSSRSGVAASRDDPVDDGDASWATPRPRRGRPARHRGSCARCRRCSPRRAGCATSASPRGSWSAWPAPRRADVGARHDLDDRRPVLAAASWRRSPRRLVGWLQRHRVPRAAGALIVLLALLALGVVIVLLVVGGIVGRERRDRGRAARGASTRSRAGSRSVGVDNNGASRARTPTSRRRCRRHRPHVRARASRTGSGDRLARLRRLVHGLQPVLPAQGRADAARVARTATSACRGRSPTTITGGVDQLDPPLLPRRHDRRGVQRRRRRASAR